MADRKGPEDTVELASLRSSGFFEAAILADGRLNVPDRYEVLQNPDREALMIEPPPENSAGESVPFPIWRNPKANQLVLAADIEQQASYQIVAFVDSGGAVEIPMVDDDGYPILSPSIPPLTCIRYTNQAAANDYVNAPGTTNLHWTDRFTCLDWDGTMDSARLKRQSQVTYRWRRDDAPRAHWVLELFHAYPDPEATGWVTHVNFLVHVLGESGGQPGWPGGVFIPNRDVEHLTAGVVGHWRIRPVPLPPVHDHLSTQDQTKMRSHIFGIGETYLQANNQRNVYLNHPNGLATDTSLFASPGVIVPAVLVYGDRDNVQNRGMTMTNWLCGTWGRGHDFATLGSPPIHNQADQYSFYTDLLWDGADWATIVYNRGTVSPADDRQFYLYGWGRHV